MRAMGLLMSSRAWRRALLVLALAWGVILYLHWPTARAMAAVWDSSETFAHAWVVPPIALWLAWRLRDSLAAIQPRPAASALLLTALLSLLWLLGQLVAVNTATQFALVGLLVLAVPAVMGWSVARALAFPLGFLFFAVPFGDFLTPYLMTWTADITVAALRLTGIPVYREGLQFVIPSGTWSVVEACSGIRYLLASLMVGALYAHLNYQSTRKRLLFIGVAILVPIVANWLRAYMIVMLGHLSGNELAVGADHLVYGWVLFGVIIMLLYWIGARWAEAVEVSPPAPPAAGPWPAGLGATVSALMLALVLMPLLLMRHFESAGSQAAPVLQSSGPWGGDWQPGADPAAAWQPVHVGPVATLRTGLSGGDGANLGVHVAYFRNQDARRKLIGSGNRLLADEGYGGNALALKLRRLPTPAGAIELREALLPAANRGPAGASPALLVWQVYWIDGQLVAGDVKGKLLGAWGRLAGRGDDSAAILLFADATQAQAAEVALSRFVATGLPALVGQLERARAGALP